MGGHLRMHKIGEAKSNTYYYSLMILHSIRACTTSCTANVVLPQSVNVYEASVDTDCGPGQGSRMYKRMLGEYNANARACFEFGRSKQYHVLALPCARTYMCVNCTVQEGQTFAVSEHANACPLRRRGCRVLRISFCLV